MLSLTIYGKQGRMDIPPYRHRIEKLYGIV